MAPASASGSPAGTRNPVFSCSTASTVPCTAVATTAPPPTQGGAVRGAARGAALGAATGSLRRGGSASSGAAAGAAAGGLMGGMRRADSGAQQQQWAQQEAANYQRNRDEWPRGFSACMRSRGYTVG